MKKPVRLFLLGMGILVVLLAAVVALAFQSGVQTWATRKAIASRPGLNARVGQVSAGFQTVAFRDLHFEQDGAVFTLPSLDAELSVVDAGLNQKVALRKLVAKGWSIDLTNYRAGSDIAPKSAAVVPAAVAVATAQVFQGIFAQAALPFDLALDGVELEGDVRLPPAPGVATGSAHFVVKGGGLAAAREGMFAFRLVVALAGAEVPVTSLIVDGQMVAVMDTPRTFSKLATKAEAAATGPQIPQGVRLASDIVATRAPDGEHYAILLSDGARPLASLTAVLPRTTSRLSGTWKFDLRDADLAPFTLGRPLPTFTVKGEGGIDADPATAELRSTGNLNVTADRLGVVRSELAAIGVVTLATDFDLALRGDNLRVERLTASLSGTHPVASVHSLQAFEFNAKTGELRVADPARSLLGLMIEGLPLTWVQPFVKEVAVMGGDIRGEFEGIARNGGFALRPKAPLLVDGLSVARAGRPLLQAIDLSLNVSADYAPQGWQTEMTMLSAKSGAAVVVALEAKAGRLFGPDQPVKAAGKFSSTLPALLGQPVAAGALRLTAGELTGDFVISLGRQQEYLVNATLGDLACDPRITQEKLPSVRLALRADVSPGGVVAINLPLSFERGGRKSDLVMTGDVAPRGAGFAIDTRLASSLLVVEDAQALALVLAPPPAGSPTAPEKAGRDAAPLWAGISGKIALVLKKIVYSDSVEVSDVTGTVSLDPFAAKIVNFRAGLGRGADAKASGEITFDAKAESPYAFAAELAVDEFDPAAIFQSLNPGLPATVEGRFSLASKVSGRAATPGDFGNGVRGDFQLASKGGVFRGLPVSYAAKAESVGKIAAGAAAIGNLFGSVTGKKGDPDLVNKAQAVAEISKALAAIPYDQLNVRCVRDVASNTILRDFTLIAPEMRLSGGGQATHRAGTQLLNQPVVLEFKLRARGHTADLLKYLGKLEATTDELGYAGCTLPLKVAGTLGKIDASELNSTFASLALEKIGVTEKASELLNKILGAGK